jgi:hypothetical protein
MNLESATIGTPGGGGGSGVGGGVVCGGEQRAWRAQLMAATESRARGRAGEGGGEEGELGSGEQRNA